METIDTVVIGAGVVGLAIAREIAQKSRDVIIIEAEKTIGSITSSRNSGVIHAGIYYRNGSNKARFSVEGKKLLYSYLKERDLPFKQCGKLIVATSAEETDKLNTIKQNAENNGVDDLVFLSKSETLAREPALKAEGSLFSPSTGIVDVHSYMTSLLADVESHGGILALCNEIVSGKISNDGITLTLASGDSIVARNVINSAGLRAQSIASSIEGLDPATIPPTHYAKGNYFSLTGAQPFTHLVYPVPVHGGLGAHFTMNMAGESIFGPDVEWISNDYDAIHYAVSDDRVAAIRHSVERYWPDVVNRTISPAYAGVRPKITGPGEPDGDFMLQGYADHNVKGLINLYGIESPGITSSLAIAKAVAAMMND